MLIYFLILIIHYVALTVNRDNGSARDWLRLLYYIPHLLKPIKSTVLPLATVGFWWRYFRNSMSVAALTFLGIWSSMRQTTAFTKVLRRLTWRTIPRSFCWNQHSIAAHAKRHNIFVNRLSNYWISSFPTESILSNFYVWNVGSYFNFDMNFARGLYQALVDDCNL